MTADKFYLVIHVGRGQKRSRLYWTGLTWASVSDFAAIYFKADGEALITKRFSKGVRHRDMTTGQVVMLEPELYLLPPPPLFYIVILVSTGRRKAKKTLYWNGRVWTAASRYAPTYLKADGDAYILKRFKGNGVRRVGNTGRTSVVRPRLRQKKKAKAKAMA